MKAACVKSYESYVSNMDSWHIADALTCVFEMLSRANKYIDETTPWTLAKDENKKDRLGTVLYNLLEVIRWAAVLLTPIIPETAEEIFSMLNLNVTFDDIIDGVSAEKGTDALKQFSSVGSLEMFGGIQVGSTVCDSKVLFARIDEAKVLAELEAEMEAKRVAAEKATKPVERPEGCALIGIEDFMNVELRTAKIVACESVPKAKKLLKLEVDLGYEKRQVVSGIAKFYKPEDLIGKKIILVANLKPATLCGIESNGMLLASGEEQVRVVFLSEDTPLGERVR